MPEVQPNINESIIAGIISNYWHWLVVIVFVILFFGRIYSNSQEHSTYVDAFSSKCDTAGGVVYIPKGVKGWGEPTCFSRSSIIDIE